MPCAEQHCSGEFRVRIRRINFVEAQSERRKGLEKKKHIINATAITWHPASCDEGESDSLLSSTLSVSSALSSFLDFVFVVDFFLTILSEFFDSIKYVSIWSKRT